MWQSRVALGKEGGDKVRKVKDYTISCGIGWKNGNSDEKESRNVTIVGTVFIVLLFAAIAYRVYLDTTIATCPKCGNCFKLAPKKGSDQ